MKNQIKLNELTLVNFKGIKKMSIPFNQITNLFGDNGTGKTTVFDAFVWLFFGKDSTDRKDFQVKTLDNQNKPIPKIDHEVNATVTIDGQQIVIRRILRENWVKKRGNLETEFAGNETLYYWDEVPLQLKEFTARVNAILDEQVFKLITNPLAFNSLNWKERRQVLVQIAGDVQDSEILQQMVTEDNRTAVESLAAILNSGKSLLDYQRQIAASIKKAKDDIKMIPTRIDEAEKSKPQVYDFDNLRNLLGAKETELAGIDSQIQDKNAAVDTQLEALRTKKTTASNLKFEIEGIQSIAKSDARRKGTPDTAIYTGKVNALNSKKNDLQTAENHILTLQSKHDTVAGNITVVSGKMDSKRSEWIAENAKEISFDDKSFCCPTCQRDFEASDVDTQKAKMIENFKADKQVKLNELNRQGLAFKAEKEALEVELNGYEKRIDAAKADVERIKGEIQSAQTEVDNDANANAQPADEETMVGYYDEILKAHPTYAVKVAELEALNNEIANESNTTAVDNSELLAQRKIIVDDIDGIKTKLRNEAQIQTVNQRIVELGDEEQALANQIAEVEKTQFLIENFNKLRIDTLERKINAKFKFVSFKMFDTQINGGEVECCDALINGVPFSDANTASKINAGLDIINTLSEFYGITAPIFIDNRESVVKLIETDSQIINLIVSETDKTLRAA